MTKERVGETCTLTLDILISCEEEWGYLILFD